MPLTAFVIVEIYVAFNGRYQAVVVFVAKVIHFALKNAPETFMGPLLMQWPTSDMLCVIPGLFNLVLNCLLV